MSARSNGTMTITPMKPADAVGVAKLHQAHIATGFLSLLGTTFLAMLYKEIARDPYSRVMVCRADGAVAGFIAGTRSVSSMYRRIVARKGIVFVMMLLPTIFRPGFLRNILQTLFYGRMAGKKPGDGTQRVDAELLSIVVSTGNRLAGVGKGLVDELERCFGTMGVSEYKVVTVADGRGADSFYRKLGFVLRRQFRHHENMMNEYVRTIAK